MKNKFLILSLLASLSFGVAAGLTLNEQSTNVEKALTLRVDADDGSTESNYEGDVFPAGTNFWVDEMSDTYDVDIYSNGQISNVDYISSGIPFTFPDTADYWVLDRLVYSGEGFSGYLLFSPLYKVTLEQVGANITGWTISGGYSGLIEGTLYGVAGYKITLNCTVYDPNLFACKGTMTDGNGKNSVDLLPKEGTTTDYLFSMPEHDVILKPHFHAHAFDYQNAQADGNSIYVTCINSGCPLENNRLTLTVEVNENLVYTGENLLPGNAEEAFEAFRAVTGTLFVTFYVWDGEKTVGDGLESVKDPGTYLMEFRIAQAIGRVIFTIDKAVYDGQQVISSVNILSSGGEETITIPVPDGFEIIQSSLTNPNNEYFDFLLGDQPNQVTIKVIKPFDRSLGESFDFTFMIGGSSYYEDYSYTVTLMPDFHVHGEVGTVHPEVAPTCEEPGHRGYYECDCGKFFPSPECVRELEDLQGWLNDPLGGFMAPIGHNYGEPTYSFNEETKEWTAIRVCQNDSSHIDTETVLAVEENGMWVGRFLNPAFVEQSIEAKKTSSLKAGAIVGITLGSILFVLIAAYITLNVLYNKMAYVLPKVGNYLVPAFKTTNSVCKTIADFSKNTFTKFISLFKKKKSE